MIYASLLKQIQIYSMSLNSYLKNCSLAFAVLKSEKGLQSSKYSIKCDYRTVDWICFIEFRM